MVERVRVIRKPLSCPSSEGAELRHGSPPQGALLWKGERLVEVKEWEHKAKRWMHLALALVLLSMGMWLVLT